MVPNRQRINENNDRIFEDADALIALAQKSFNQAAKNEVTKNDALGIPTHGAVGDTIVIRQPVSKNKPAVQKNL